jgi:hypothetical protein
MKRSVSHSIAFAGGIAATLAALAFHRWDGSAAPSRVVAPPPIDTPRAPTLPQADLQLALADLRQGQRALGERFEQLELRPTRRVVAQVPRHEGDQAVLVASLAELRADLDADATALRDANSPDRLRRLREDKPETDWNAVHTWVGEWDLDEAATQQDLQLSTYAEILVRFGPPTALWSNEKGTHWVYGEGLDPATQEYTLELYLRFADGLVTYVGLARR